jgi:hypothetical protein
MLIAARVESHGSYGFLCSPLLPLAAGMAGAEGPENPGFCGFGWGRPSNEYTEDENMYLR